ncbi:hypothetical protein GCM10022214_25630 [Actinomadura miaoliensis]|uniref:Uncharacterized protein n=2 Tax=Actinomadura miaoliensis TaxID=430685 RepID=A0ABP7VKJ9_9ACTN
MIHALHERSPVHVGEVVVVQGSGPVGLAAGIGDRYFDVVGGRVVKAVLES